MKWSDVGKNITKAAPMLGAAIGGPGGAAIGALIASAFGVDGSPDAVNSAIMQSPDAALKLRELELRHTEALEQLSISRLSEELKDTQSARENHKQSCMPAIITMMLTLMVAALLWAMFDKVIPDDQSELAMMMFGQVFTLWGASISYWVGTTRSSAVKNSFLASNR
jgi:hypothetical protein